MRFLSDLAHFTVVQILVFGSFLLGVYYFVWYDDGSSLRSSIADVQTNIEQTSEKINTKKEELENVKSFEREILNEEDVVKQFLNFIPSSLTFTEVSSLLINEATSSGINIEVKKDQKVEEKEDSDYHTLTVRLTVSGAFAQILLFLSKLTSQKRMFVVRSIDMRIDGDTGLREADLLIDTYRYEKRSRQEEVNTKASEE